MSEPTSSTRKYLAAIGRKGGKAGKGSAKRKASAVKANRVRWEKHRANGKTTTKDTP